MVVRIYYRFSLLHSDAGPDNEVDKKKVACGMSEPSPLTICFLFQLEDTPKLGGAMRYLTNAVTHLLLFGIRQECA